MTHRFAVAFLLASVAASAGENTAPAAPAAPIGFSPSILDKSVDPCVDFYEFACGGWRKANPIPADQSRWGRFNQLAERNREELRAILEQARDATRKRSAIEARVGDYYAACMDEAGIEARGVEPIRPMLARIDAIGTKGDLFRLLGEHEAGGLPTLFRFGAAPDLHDSRQTIASFGQGGIGRQAADVEDFEFSPHAGALRVRAARQRPLRGGRDSRLEREHAVRDLLDVLAIVADAERALVAQHCAHVLVAAEECRERRLGRGLRIAPAAEAQAHRAAVGRGFQGLQFQPQLPRHADAWRHRPGPDPLGAQQRGQVLAQHARHRFLQRLGPAVAGQGTQAGVAVRHALLGAEVFRQGRCGLAAADGLRQALRAFGDATRRLGHGPGVDRSGRVDALLVEAILLRAIRNVGLVDHGLVEPARCIRRGVGTLVRHQRCSVLATDAFDGFTAAAHRIDTRLPIGNLRVGLLLGAAAQAFRERA